MPDKATTTGPRTGPSVLIVGAGLAGLATAISVALATATPGHAPAAAAAIAIAATRPNVTIIEALPGLAPIGAGLQLTPNATRLLRQWGLLGKLEALCAEPKRLVVHRYANGEVLACDSRFSEQVRARYEGNPFIDVHRGDLQELLYERAKELGVEVVWDERVKDIVFDRPEGPAAEVTAESGKIYEADLVIGADGIWSRCREALLGRQDPPLPTGDLAYRIVLTLDQLGDDRELKEWVQNPECHFWIGPQSHVVGYSVRRGEMFNLVLLCPDDLPADVARQRGETSEMKKLFEGWDPILTRFIDKVVKVDKWKLMHRPAMDRWVSLGGSLALIGDSCHPMLPYLAQGANSAMEDGFVLGWCLGQVQQRDQLQHAINLYEKVRKERSERVAKETFLQRHQFHMPDGPEQEERDAIFASQLGKDEIDDTTPFPSRWTCGIAQRWLYGYDAYAAAREALEQNPL